MNIIEFFTKKDINKNNNINKKFKVKINSTDSLRYKKWKLRKLKENKR